MSVREFPEVDSSTRQERAEQTEILDVRVIDGETFELPDEHDVFEVDLINERGQLRENVTIVPSILYESTHDVRYRHEFGIVGKYTRALAHANENALEQLQDGITAARREIHERQGELRRKDSRLMHTAMDIKEFDDNYTEGVHL